MLIHPLPVSGLDMKYLRVDELTIMRTASKAVNPGENPGRPAISGIDSAWYRLHQAVLQSTPKFVGFRT